MDIRDPIKTQVQQHIDTLHILAGLETPAALVWKEVSAYLEESAVYLETFVLEKIELKTPHVDLRGNAEPPKVAEYVGVTSAEAALEDAEPNVVSTFLPPQRNGARA